MAAGRSGRNKYRKDEDFEEGDVWGVMEERQSSSSPRNLKSMMMMMMMMMMIKDYSSVSPLISPASSSPRMIPRSSSSLAINEGCKKQFSAPLDIPDWSKIYGKRSKKKGMNVATPSSSSSSSTTTWVHGVSYHHGHGDGHDDGNDDDDDGHVEKEMDDDDDDDDDGMVLPPHEYIARKLARSQISSFSVCEGMGRTLKGRDLKKVRNAILTRTGFLE